MGLACHDFYIWLIAFNFTSIFRFFVAAVYGLSALLLTLKFLFRIFCLIYYEIFFIIIIITIILIVVVVVLVVVVVVVLIIMIKFIEKMKTVERNNIIYIA